MLSSLFGCRLVEAVDGQLGHRMVVESLDRESGSFAQVLGARVHQRTLQRLRDDVHLGGRGARGVVAQASLRLYRMGLERQTLRVPGRILQPG